MHMVMTCHFGRFLLMLIVTLPLFEPLQSQNISSISHNCETKQSPLGGKGNRLACSIFSHVLVFQLGNL